MKLRSGVTFALIAGLGLGGCAAGAAGVATGPTVAVDGRTYEPGTPPTPSRFAQASTIALVQGDHAAALTEARAGIEAEPGNPHHFYLAGEAAAGLENYTLADSMWTVAESIYPAYELEIEPSRENAWAAAFNAGVESYNDGDLQGAIRDWANAHLIYRLRPDAAVNLGLLLTQDAQYEAAMNVYRESLAALERVPATWLIDEEEEENRREARSSMRESLVQLLLYTEQFPEAERILQAQLAEDPNSAEAQVNLATVLARQGRAAEASELYGRILQAPGLTPEQLSNVGVSLFNANEYARAAEAFGRLTQVQPNSRDAWYNQANALYAGELWSELAPVATRLVALDPLNENAALILARTHRELEQNQRALEALEALAAAPVFLDELQMVPAGDQTTLRGSVTGNAAAAGSTVRLQFTFYNGANPVGTQTVNVSAPAREQSAPFTVSIAQAANAYSYEVLP